MLSKKKKKILFEMLIWSLILIVLTKATINVVSKRGNYNEELKKFYAAQYERDQALIKKKKVVSEFPSTIIKSLVFLFFVICLLVHRRFKIVINLDNQKAAQNNQSITKNDPKKENLFAIIFLVVFFYIAFLILHGLGIAFFDSDNDYPKLSTEQRIKRNLDKIAQIKKISKTGEL